MRVDTTIAQGAIRPPDVIKIDTDGLELAITSGMKTLLTGQKRPRSVLVEVQQEELPAQKTFMDACGYALVATHFTGRWKPRREQGWSLDELAFNALFEPSDQYVGQSGDPATSREGGSDGVSFRQRPAIGTTLPWVVALGPHRPDPSAQMDAGS